MVTIMETIKDIIIIVYCLIKEALSADKKMDSVAAVVVRPALSLTDTDLCLDIGLVICYYNIYCFCLNIKLITNVHTEPGRRAVAVCGTLFGAFFDGTFVAVCGKQFFVIYVGICKVVLEEIFDGVSGHRKMCGWFKDEKGNMRHLVQEKNWMLWVVMITKRQSDKKKITL